MFDNLFTQVGAILVLVSFLGLLANKFKQPMVSAYILTGILVGPLLFNFIHDTHIWQAFSEIGVVLLLFLLGLGMSMDHLRTIGKTSIKAGIAQFFITFLVSFLMLKTLNFGWSQSVILAAASVFSSTIVVIKLLTEKRHLVNVYGRYSVGLLLIQDLLAIVLIMILATQNGSKDFLLTFQDFVFKGSGLFLLVFVFSKYFLPKLLKPINKSGDLLLLVSLAWCFLISWLAQWLGFSLEMGAVVAGLSLAATDYSLSIRSKIKPLQDFFIMLFFVILGSKFNLVDLEKAILPGLLLTTFILFVKSGIIFYIYRNLGFTRHNSFMISSSLAQASEFGFILIMLAYEMDFVDALELKVFTIAALLSITVSSFFINHNEKVYKFFRGFLLKFGPEKYHQPEIERQIYDVWLIGAHRIGESVIESLRKNDKSFAVIDHELSVIKKLKKDNIPSYFGDIQDFEFLESLDIDKAELIISTVATKEPQNFLCDFLNMRHSKAKLILTLEHEDFPEEMYAKGADYVIMPQLMTANLLLKLLEDGKITKKEIEELKKKQ